MDAVTAGQEIGFDPFWSPSKMLEASEFVALGEVIDVEPGLQVERENPIPDGYEPEPGAPREYVVAAGGTPTARHGPKARAGR